MYMQIGSISCGTLVPLELAGNLAFSLERLLERDRDMQRKTAARPALAAYRKALALGDDDELNRFNEELAPAVFEQYCAPYTSFRTHAGDGTEFGVYPDIELLQEDARVRNGVICVDAGDAWPRLAADIEYVMEVSDHGNVSLYSARTRKELWACV